MGNNNDSQHSEINVNTYPSIRGSTAKLPYTNVLYTNVRSLTRGAKRDELKMLIVTRLILLEFQKPGAKLISWILKWKFQDSSYTDKTGQQLTIKREVELLSVLKMSYNR